MARQIVLHFQGADVPFDFSAVDRARIYGRKRRVPLDRSQQPCTRAALLRDGSLILRAGMTAQGSFDESGTWIPNGELVGLDAEGNALPKVESTLGVPVQADATTAQDLLDHAIGTIYALTPPTWCALDTPPPPPVEESAEDDLDFEMFG